MLSQLRLILSTQLTVFVNLFERGSTTHNQHNHTRHQFKNQQFLFLHFFYLFYCLAISFVLKKYYHVFSDSFITN